MNFQLINNLFGIIKLNSVKVPLQPRHFKSKTRQKGRNPFYFNINYTLHYGNCGFLILRPLRLTAKQLSKFKAFVRRGARKNDKTRRFMWFNVFPHLPLTKKTEGSRMGKGRGKLIGWFTNVRGGTVLFEFKNVRPGRAFFFMNQISFKLGLPFKKILKKSFHFNFPLKLSKKILFRAFW